MLSSAILAMCPGCAFAGMPLNSKKMVSLELSILCADLSRAGGILTNNFERHGALQCREAKQTGELDWRVDNLHDKQWHVVLILDQFRNTHGDVVQIVLYVILFLLLFFWAYEHICAGRMASGRAHGFWATEYQSRGDLRLQWYAIVNETAIANHNAIGHLQPELEIAD